MPLDMRDMMVLSWFSCGVKYFQCGNWCCAGELVPTQASWGQSLSLKLPSVPKDLLVP